MASSEITRAPPTLRVSTCESTFAAISALAELRNSISAIWLMRSSSFSTSSLSAWMFASSISEMSRSSVTARVRVASMRSVFDVRFSCNFERKAFAILECSCEDRRFLLGFSSRCLRLRSRCRGCEVCLPFVERCGLVEGFYLTARRSARIFSTSFRRFPCDRFCSASISLSCWFAHARPASPPHSAHAIRPADG